MQFIYLILLSYLLNIGSDSAEQSQPSPQESIFKSIAFHQATTIVVDSVRSTIPAPIALILESKDGGKTWEDISSGLPENEQPEEFFAGESEVYLRVKDLMYRSKTNSEKLSWQREHVDPRNASIAFNRSGMMAFNYDGQVYQNISGKTWLPILTNFKKYSMRSIFETSDGTIFTGYDAGLFKSTDKGKSWKQVQDEGWVMEMLESEGVLIATGQKGIMRSTDKGESWQWVVSEGGVGIDIEHIDGGFAAISCNTTTFSRGIRVSLDNGKTWKAADEGLRPTLFISSVKYIDGSLICGHPDGIYRSTDNGKTWKLVHPGVGTKELSADPAHENMNVFKIHVSGNTVYAVAGSAGC